MNNNVSSTNAARTDSEVIHDILLGNQDRFAELVERYQRTLYGIAWSRLRQGDASEDVVQETFLQAYRFLPFLRDTSRFPGWLTRIARNLANQAARRTAHHANFLTEQVEQANRSLTVEVHEPGSQWDLSRAMESMSSTYREALILFYLENKNIRECAELLNVSEATFKTRLHRARNSMKKQLEESLETDLQQLGNRVDVSARVMSGIAALPPGLAKFGGTLALPFGMMGLLQLWAPLASVAIMQHYFVKNYRDENQVRKRLLNHNLMIIAILCTCLLVAMAVARHYLGMGPVFAGLAGILFSATIHRYRQWRLGGNRFIGAIALSACTMASWCIVLALAGYATKVFGLPLILFATIIMPVAGLIPVFANKDNPMRSDYNLFQRAAMGTVSNNELEPVQAVTRGQLEKFTRYLASLHLAVDRCSWDDGWSVALPPVSPAPLQLLIPVPVIYQNTSKLFIDPSGRCRALLSHRDRASLVRLFGKFDSVQIQMLVEKAVISALARFAADDANGALTCLQSESDAQLFRRPPQELPMQKWMPILGVIVLLLTIATFCFSVYVFGMAKRPASPPRPVSQQR